MEQPAHDEYDENSTNQEPNPKRRKVRKGTRSCWNCKNRKVKCKFESIADSVCISCSRRGATCISQEHPEEDSYAEDSRDQLLERVVGVKPLLEDLLKRIGQYVERDGSSPGLGQSGKPKSSVFTPFSDMQSTGSYTLSVRVPKYAHLPSSLF
jgi:hypothetical protein